MKKIYSLALLSILALPLFADIPAGSTIYLDVTQAWCCKPTYAVCCSGLGDAYFIMHPVAGYDGVYYYTTTQAIQSNFRFGYSTQTITHDGLGWSAFETRDIDGSYSSSKPYYIMSDEYGHGTWAASPQSTGATALDSVVVSTPTTCIDSTYDVIVSVYFTGAPCSAQLTGDQWATPYKTTTIANPLVLKQTGFKENAGVNHSVTVTLYSDKNYTTTVASVTADYQSPEIECTVEYDLGDQCTNKTLVIAAETEGDVYIWSNGETTRSIQITPSPGKQTYTVEVYGTLLRPEENLMANGDFESNPPTGFISDYDYAGWNPSSYYDDHAGASNLYAITMNANLFWHDYASISPHGGTYYALFDAGKSGYAWKATTTGNPALIVERDSVYLFSYWAAYPNKSADNSPAILQFEIKYRDPNGVMQTKLLGGQYKLGQEEKLNGWYQQTVSWKAPCNSEYVEIGVKDLNDAEGGNDFCLDDIMFQKASVTNIVLSHKEIYRLNGIDCTEPEPCVDNWLRTKWIDILFVDNSAGDFVRYQWYKNDQAIEGATEQYYCAGTDLTTSKDLYHAEMWRVDGSKVTTCQKTFGEISPSRNEYPAPAEAKVLERRVHIIGAHFRIVETIYEDGSVKAVKEVY